MRLFVWVVLFFEALKWRNGVNDGVNEISGRRLAAISNPNYSFCSEIRHNRINTQQFKSFFGI